MEKLLKKLEENYNFDELSNEQKAELEIIEDKISMILAGIEAGIEAGILNKINKLNYKELQLLLIFIKGLKKEEG
ncbi:MAG TPA: hypothetical protein VJ962_05895 [Clostridia bacterium]|nr:hypothetical protein [Clostridia bacterium]